MSGDEPVLSDWTERYRPMSEKELEGNEMARETAAPAEDRLTP